MSDSLLALLERAERLIGSKSEKDVVAGLGELISHRAAIRSGGLGQKAKYYHLMARGLQKQSRFERALLKARVALTIARKMNDEFLVAELKYRLGSLLLSCGKPDRSFDSFNEAYVGYKHLGRQADAAMALSQMGHVTFQRGDLSGAFRRLEEAHSLLPKEANTEFRASLWINMARIVLIAGDFDKFEDLVSRTDFSNVDSEHSLHLLLLQALERILKLEYVPAEQLLQEFQRRSQGRSNPVLQLVSLEYRGLLELLRENNKEAARCFEEIMEMPDKTLATVSQTLRMRTELLIKEGNLQLAEEVAQEAEVAAIAAGENIELGALWRSFGLILCDQQKKKEARRYFEKSVEVLENSGARYELALTHLVIGQLEELEAGQRFYHLETARHLFSTMNVPARVEQAEGSLATLREKFISAEGLLLKSEVKLKEGREYPYRALREKNLSDVREAVRRGLLSESKLTGFVERAIYREGPVTKGMIESSTGIPPEMVELCLGSLEGKGRVKSERRDGLCWYSGNSLVRKIRYAR